MDVLDYKPRGNRQTCNHSYMLLGPLYGTAIFFLVKLLHQNYLIIPRSCPTTTFTQNPLWETAEEPVKNRNEVLPVNQIRLCGTCAGVKIQNKLENLESNPKPEEAIVGGCFGTALSTYKVIAAWLGSPLFDKYFRSSCSFSYTRSPCPTF